MQKIENEFEMQNRDSREEFCTIHLQKHLHTSMNKYFVFLFVIKTDRTDRQHFDSEDNSTTNHFSMMNIHEDKDDNHDQHSIENIAKEKYSIEETKRFVFGNILLEFVHKMFDVQSDERVVQTRA